MKSDWLLALFVGTALTFTGCRHLGSQSEQVTLQEKLLSHPNPMSYEFDAAVRDVQGATQKAFDKWREEQTRAYQSSVWKGSGDTNSRHLLTLALQLSGSMHLLWKGDGDALAKDLLTKAGNENDAYLVGMEAPVGESKVYFKNGQPLIYYADFHIHLTAVGLQRTRVEIFTYDPNVVTGVDESWSPHGPSFIGVKVDPTTVEEYQILLGIGAQLGTKDMPPLVTPGSDSPVKELTLPRER
jgi:hypothetical protein